MSPYFSEKLHKLGSCLFYQEVQKSQQSADVSQPLGTPGLMQGRFLKLVADNTDHNTQPLDGLNTFHSLRMTSAVNPGIKCTSKIIPCVAARVEGVAAIAKVDNYFYKNVERCNIRYEKKLPEIGKFDYSRNTDLY